VRRHRGDEIAIELLRRFPPVAHPLVRRHPVNGRPALWLSPLYMTQIEATSSADSAALLDVLHRGIEDSEVQVRWKWREGDVAIWDEQSTVHRALGDHFPQTRVMRRCTVD
jgi:taurine dioxygenase